MATATRHRTGELGLAATASPDGLVLLSPAWTLEAANPAAIALLGGGNSLVRGKPFAACVPSGERGPCEDWLLRIATRGPTPPLRLEWARPPAPTVDDGPRAAGGTAALVLTGRALPAGG